MKQKSVALVGARGHTGAELVRLLLGHPSLRLAAASSRELAGRPVADAVPGARTDLAFTTLGPDDLRRQAFDVVILAMPNGAAAPFVEAIDAAGPDTVIVDLSADYRFDDAWEYGLPEKRRAKLEGARRIANPGCYATGIQFAVLPLLDLATGPVHAFGVSGYSGAGTTPSPRNDPEALRDNLMPYALTGHIHERETTRHLGTAVHFMPHVAPFFRGITLTLSIPLKESVTRDDLVGRYRSAYDREPLVSYQEAAPLVRDIAGAHDCRVGGLTLDESGRRAVVVATIDNLLKGAATQALQNINLACGFEEFAGIPIPGRIDAASPAA